VSDAFPEGIPSIDLDELLNPDERLRFRRLCMATSSTDLAELVGVVRMHLDRVIELADHRTDVDTAEQIASRLEQLLTSHSGFAPDERALIRGAVEYFLLSDDADGDIENVVGFDDDVRVLNSVLDHVGRADLRVELE
jgi:uncharacterized membrane protein YkvA (DUF1232 family)